VLDREVYFPLAGYAGPGFHTWPSGHIPQATDPKPLLRIRPHAKKTFGEAFGAATGVSDPSYRRKRHSGARAPLPHDPDTKRLRGGQAATVAGHVGPGFHNWPSGHIPQATDTRPRPRIRSPTQKTFGETFGEACAATVVSSFASKDRAAPGPATPATEEKDTLARARHFLMIRIRNDYAAAKPPL
jgi:hypothetical protein